MARSNDASSGGGSRFYRAAVPLRDRDKARNVSRLEPPGGIENQPRFLIEAIWVFDRPTGDLMSPRNFAIAL